MNKKTVEEKLKVWQNRSQEEFVEKILGDVKWLNEKSNKMSYKPTEHERETFNRIKTIIDNMASWF